MAEPRRTAGLEPWFVAAALLALGNSGVAPMLVPLEVVRIEGKALHVGLVMAAMGLGLVTAPLWSRLAERRNAHRGTMVGGALAIAAALAGYVVAREWHEWAALAFVLGAGTAATFTVANVVIIERFPAETQHAAIGWLQALTTLGTVVGLLLAGAVTHWHLDEGVGFAAAALVAVAAAPVLHFLVPPMGATRTAASLEAVDLGIAAARDLSPNAMVVAEASHGAAAGSGQPTGTGGRRLRLFAFSLLLAAWIASLLGVNAVSALYPLLMQREFHVPPAISSYALAVTTLLSMALFLPASRFTARRGGLVVLQASLAVRFTGLALLAVMATRHTIGTAWLAFVPYAAFTLVWPLLSVSSTLLITRLGLVVGGAGPGLGSAASAIASLAGPVVGGHVADTFGYDSVWALAATGVALALLLTLPLVRVAAEGRHETAGQATAKAAST